MSVLYRLYESLRSTEDPSVDLSMAAALATAEPRAARLIALLLLERRHPQATAALVRCFDRLPADVQDTIIRHANDLYRPLREVAAENNPTATVNALRIIRRSGSTRLAYLVAEQLRHGPEMVRNQAAACLLEMARHVAARDKQDGPAVDPVSAGYLQAAVEEAVTHYRSHAQPLTLIALAVLAPRPMPQTLAALEDATHEAVEPLRQALERAEDPDIRRSLLTWAAVPKLTESVVAGIARAIETGRVADVLLNWHLMLSQAVRRTVAHLPRVDHPCLYEEGWAGWPAEAARGLPEWITALPLKPADQLEALSRLARHADRQVRLGALLRLIDRAEHAAGHAILTDRTAATFATGRRGSATATDGAVCTALEPFCFDSDPAIARIALRQLAQRRWSGLPRLLLQLVNVPHQEIRQLAGDYLAPLGFDRYWENWQRLDPTQRIAAGRALIKLDPCFHRHLSKRLTGPRDQCIRALTMIQELNQGSFFEEALIALSQDADPYIAASAVAALGTVQSEAAAAAREAALSHRDSRVRANAVEAMQQAEAARHVDQLAAMALEEDNRPRANAIAHLLQLRSGHALTALRVMLEDERPAHRLSALWLVEAAGLIEVARHVAELSISDPDPEVRQRAAHIIEQLMRAMRGDMTPGRFPSQDTAEQLARRSA